MMRMLDRLGIWSVAVRGAMGLERLDRPDLGPRHLWFVDKSDGPGRETGHVWLVAPPFVVVDITAKHQRWQEEAFRTALPGPVLVETASEIRPVADDIVCDDAQLWHTMRNGRDDPNLHLTKWPQLPNFWRTFRPLGITIDQAHLRYVPMGATASDVPLEQIAATSNRAVRPIDIWRSHVAPAFGVSA
jgi:hypothetical protein